MSRVAGLDRVRRLWLGWLALALLARALVPGGWMPAVDAHGLRLILCSGWVETPDPAPVVRGHQATGEHRVHEGHAGGSNHQPDKKSDHPVPCTFAASALSAPLAPAPTFIVPVSVLGSLAFAVALVRVGRGPAAPPPPSTGPPHLS